MRLEAGYILLQFGKASFELSCMEEMRGCFCEYEDIQELRKVQFPLNVCLHFADVGKEGVDNLPVDDEEGSLIRDFASLANHPRHLRQILNDNLDAEKPVIACLSFECLLEVEIKEDQKTRRVLTYGWIDH